MAEFLVVFLLLESLERLSNMKLGCQTTPSRKAIVYTARKNNGACDNTGEPYKKTRPNLALRWIGFAAH